MEPRASASIRRLMPSLCSRMKSTRIWEADTGAVEARPHRTSSSSAASEVTRATSSGRWLGRKSRAHSSRHLEHCQLWKEWRIRHREQIRGSRTGASLRCSAPPAGRTPRRTGRRRLVGAGGGALPGRLLAHRAAARVHAPRRAGTAADARRSDRPGVRGTGAVRGGARRRPGAGASAGHRARRPAGRAASDAAVRRARRGPPRRTGGAGRGAGARAGRRGAGHRCVRPGASLQ